MLLTEADIKRLQDQGYPKESFVRFDPERYALLRNRQGHCVFYNPEKRLCEVYEFRPEGCRIYPVMYDEDAGIVLDSICPAQATITTEEQACKGQEVLAILKRVDVEAQTRRK
jgi:Fe-S-cluster containining protein